MTPVQMGEPRSFSFARNGLKVEHVTGEPVVWLSYTEYPDNVFAIPLGQLRWLVARLTGIRDYLKLPVEEWEVQS